MQLEDLVVSGVGVECFERIICVFEMSGPTWRFMGISRVISRVPLRDL